MEIDMVETHMMKDIAANNQSEMLNGETANPTEEQQTISTVPTNGTQEEEVQERPQRKSTPYERLSFDLSNDQRCLKEITLGKRIGFYRIRGELGTGNFSQVKMGIHALVKGNHIYIYTLYKGTEYQTGNIILKEILGCYNTA